VDEKCNTVTPEILGTAAFEPGSGIDLIELLELGITASSTPVTLQGVPERTHEAPDAAGSFRIIREIGIGGMGVTYLAVQESPLQREVAVKVLRGDRAYPDLAERFRRESQALARLKHENIARVIDAGSIPDGRPYFAMEYVSGLPLTEFCDSLGLDSCGRIEIFLQVCAAVEHIHQKGMLHRDLKPANILVDTTGEAPVVKIIDFGIAKAFDGTLRGGTTLTSLGHLIGTPQYMAPEQADLDDTDTRSDQYALGAILYELLAGSPPIDFSGEGSGAYSEFHRRIMQEKPERPSQRALLQHAAFRRPRAAARWLRGGLDWVILKSLEKDPDRRYGNVSEFTADIGRFLANEPVLARRPSRFFRLRKWVRRNPLPTVVAALAIVLVWIGVRTYLVEREARHRQTQALQSMTLALSTLKNPPENSYPGLLEMKRSIFVNIAASYSVLGMDDSSERLAAAALSLELGLLELRGRELEERRLVQATNGLESQFLKGEEVQESEPPSEREEARAGPKFLNGHAVAYDMARRMFVVFGGLGPEKTLSGRTWGWDGRIWHILAEEASNRNPHTAPSPRSGHSMIYDPERAVTLLHGGKDDSRVFSDTWEWDGSMWTLVDIGTLPRYLHSMFYDTKKRRAVIYGGLTDKNTTPPFMIVTNDGQLVAPKNRWWAPRDLVFKTNEKFVDGDLYEWTGEDWRIAERQPLWPWLWERLMTY